MARNTDFIGFTFNGCHSSEFNIYSVSDGSRYQDNLVPNPIDYTEQVPGGVGQYYFGSDMDIKEFPLSIAYDNLSELQVRELRNWLAPDTVGELIFDERPYKTYTAKISTSPSLSFICFDKYNSNTGKKERVYKGEGSINFVCYYPLGVVSGDKKQLGWYREQIDDRIYRSIGGSSSIIDYKLENNEIAIFEKIKGNTIEIGSGDKSPDNPYNIVGSNPTKVTVCGRNMIGNWMQGMISTEDGNTITSNTHWVYAQDFIPISGNEIVSVDAVCRAVIYFYDSVKGYVGEIQPFMSANLPYRLANYADYGRAKYVRIGYNFKGAQETITPDEMGVKHFVQMEKGDTATPYEPYTGQTITLPALEPLYGDGTVNDEYDAATGVETRRWGRVEFDGTEAWSKNYPSDNDSWLYLIPGWVRNFSIIGTPMVCTHLPYKPKHPMAEIGISNPTASLFINFLDAIGTNDIPHLKAYLAAQYAAGTPVTVLYQLAEPIITKIEENLPFSNFLPSADSGLIINANPEYYNYFTDSNANISLRLYGAKYSNIDEWALSTGMIEDLDTTGVNKGYDHYITLPDGSKGIQLFNPGDKDTDFILSFNKPTPMNDIVFTLSNGEQFMLNLRSSDTDVEDYGAVSDAEKRIAVMTGGVITIDTKKNRIMYKYGTGENVNEESIYFALKKGQFFKIPKNRTSTGGYNLVIGTTSNIETDSIKISYDYLYY